jgi:hypothetical protein
MYSYQKCNNLITEKNLPRIQNYLDKNNNNISSPQHIYQVNAAFSLYNPNNSGSPPNDFMKNLEKRMNYYHTGK